MAISGILISILVSMVAFRQFSLPQSQADLSTEVAVAPPYLRIVKKNLEFVSGKKILTVDVLANTSGMPVTGADVIVTYDPSVLKVMDDTVASTGVLKVFNLNSISDGKADFSVFSEKTRDEPILQTNADQEIAIATLQFEVLNTSLSLTEVGLEFEPDQLTDSNLVLFKEPRPETPTDILKSVQSAIISL